MSPQSPEPNLICASNIVMVLWVTELRNQPLEQACGGRATTKGKGDSGPGPGATELQKDGAKATLARQTTRPGTVALLPYDIVWKTPERNLT